MLSATEKARRGGRHWYQLNPEKHQEWRKRYWSNPENVERNNLRSRESAERISRLDPGRKKVQQRKCILKRRAWLLEKRDAANILRVADGLPPILRRKEAAAQGLTFFSTGRKCKRGHPDKKYVSMGQCVGCRHLVYLQRRHR